MEGLRQRARAAFPGGLYFDVSFHKTAVEVEVAEILNRPGQSPSYTERKLPCQKLVGEIRDSTLNRTPKESTQQKPDFTSLQLITIGSQVLQSNEVVRETRPGYLIDLPQGDFLDLFDACEIEPYFLYSISQNANGYQHFKHQPSASKNGHVDSFYLCSPWLTAIWSYNASMGNMRAIVLLPKKPVLNERIVKRNRFAMNTDTITNTRLVTFQGITEILREQQNLVDNPSFLHLVFSTEIITCLYDVLRDEGIWLRRFEILLWTVQESQAVGGLPELGAFDYMPPLWKLVKASKVIGFFTSDLAIVARQNDVALELLGTLAKTRGIKQPDDTWTSESKVPSHLDQAAEGDLGQAISLLYRQAAAQKKDIQQLQQRASNRSSMVRGF